MRTTDGLEAALKLLIFFAILGLLAAAGIGIWVLIWLMQHIVIV